MNLIVNGEKINFSEKGIVTAIKGNDFIQLLNADGKTVIEYNGISSFDNYVLEGGVFENPHKSETQTLQEQLFTVTTQLVTKGVI